MINEWCTIESDPGVFTELIRDLGVKNVAVEEIYSFDDEILMNSLKPIHGLIFLFKWQKSPEKRPCLEYYDNDLFFANQVIPNACATQAILAVLLNAKDIDVGPELNTFKSFAQGLDSQSRGMALNDADHIRKVHNSFARPEPFVISHDKKKEKKGDAYHFISYVPQQGKLYELDGLQEGPIVLGDCTDETWLDLAKIEINQRIQKYAESEIRFTLLAVVGCKRQTATVEIKRLKNIRANIYKVLLEKHASELSQQLAHKANESLKELESPIQPSEIPHSKEDLLKKIQEIDDEVSKNELIIADEVAKYKRYEAENIRRKHNYLPFIIELLKLTAKKGKLKELVDSAQEKHQAKLAKAKEKEKEKEGQETKK